jgi:SAM-dependent methyltransferase
LLNRHARVRTIDALDPLAQRGFGASVEAARVYERGRPGYAPALAPWLVDELGLSRSSRVLDLAAGTGQLSRLLMPLVGSVVAVEPAAAMRQVLASQVPGAELLDGVAEQLPLPDASIDAAVVGNAFHWFDGDVALGELARVLRPGGGLAIVWNIGRETEPPTPRLEAYVAGLRTRAGLGPMTASQDPAWRRAFAATDAFAPLRYRELLHTREQDRETFVAYLASLAFIAALPDRDTAVERIRELAPEVSILSMRTECHWTHRSTA